MVNKILAYFLAWVSTATVAIGEGAAPGGYMQMEYIQDPNKFYAMMNNLPDWAPVIISALVCLMIAFRAMSEILLLLADKIPGDGDKKAARIMKSISIWIGKLLGQVGVGMPKKMVMEQAEKEIGKK